MNTNHIILIRILFREVHKKSTTQTSKIRIILGNSITLNST